MGKPVLVVLAAGFGSRYGGLKQIDPVDDDGHIIIDYLIYDAYRTGFEKVICVINPQIENEFKEVIGNRVSKYIELQYASLPHAAEAGKGHGAAMGSYAENNCRGGENMRILVYRRCRLYRQSYLCRAYQ